MEKNHVRPRSRGGEADLEIPPLPIPVGLWAYKIREKYQSEDDIRKTRVPELRWHKDIGGMEQEFVVATCQHGGSDENVYLLLGQAAVREQDRLSQMITGFKLNKAEMAILEKYPSEGRPKIEALGSASESGDSVMQVEDSLFDIRPSLLISRYQDFEHPLYLRDLALLADHVHEYSPVNNSFIHHCYWYARTIIDIVVDTYRPTTTVRGDHFEAAGTYTMSKDRQGTQPSSGSSRHRGIRIVKECPEVVDLIRNVFQHSLAAHDAMVGSIRCFDELEVALSPMALDCEKDYEFLGEKSEEWTVEELGDSERITARKERANTDKEEELLISPEPTEPKPTRPKPQFKHTDDLMTINGQPPNWMPEPAPFLSPPSDSGHTRAAPQQQHPNHIHFLPLPPPDQPYLASLSPPTAPPTSLLIPLGSEVNAILGLLLERFPTSPNTMNVITINIGSGNVTGNTHSHVNNVVPWGPLPDARKPRLYESEDDEFYSDEDIEQ